MSRYLDLMKQTLTHSLWDETTQPLDSRRTPVMWKQRLVKLAQAFFQPFGLRLVWNKPVDKEAKAFGETWPEFSHTMVGMERLNALQSAAETIFQRNIPGDFIECGVWRGGASIFLRAVMDEYNQTERTLFVADSFSGLPKSEIAVDSPLMLHKIDYLAVSLEEVQDNFKRYGLLSRVQFLKGFFEQQSFSEVKQLSLLRLDGDLYSSTMTCLEKLYDKVSPGGFVIIDDYSAITACKQAVDEFRQARGITAPLVFTDLCEAYWIKSPKEGKAS